ncbi:type I restriction enzyme, S subunit [Sphingobium xenophagum]|uniref:Type I restriction enzyme, S subunit n=2 Tax=Sphingobium xenophagum TaxID=121428 RepID=A0A401J210_SPHXE|nr:type I restriction enzyme, S subunit [Sphingobium xenophagum]
MIPRGTIIVPTRMAVGKAAIASIDLAINQDLKALFPKSDIDTRYLLHVLLAFSEKLLRFATGATVKGITLDVLRALEVPLPSLPEQRRIAAILDQADALRRLRRQSLARLSDLEAAMFFDTFVSGAKSDWRETNVADLVDKNNGGIRTGPFGSQLLHSEFVDEGIAVLGIDNAVSNSFRWAKQRYITPQKYAELTRYKVHPGDVLITIMGTCGRCAIVPDSVGEAINTKHLCCISLDQDRCLPEFLHAYFLRHPTARHYLKSRSKGAIMDGLNMGIIKELPVILPPLSTQEKFKRSLEALSGPASRGEMALADIESLFTSIQHRAFRGEL